MRGVDNCRVLQKPDLDEWGTSLDAMQSALNLEKNVNQSLLDLHKVAASHDDAQVCVCLWACLCACLCACVRASVCSEDMGVLLCGWCACRLTRLYHLREFSPLLFM